jgi:hypothetical protein
MRTTNHPLEAKDGKENEKSKNSAPRRTRKPWEIKLTPEEEREICERALKYKPIVNRSRWFARAMSALFFAWLFLGCFSFDFVVKLSSIAIMKLSLVCTFFYGICSVISQDQWVTAGVKKLDKERERDLVAFYRKAVLESVWFTLLHGGIALVANFSRL